EVAAGKRREGGQVVGRKDGGGGVKGGGEFRKKVRRKVRKIGEGGLQRWR
ncbi:hypothetical protein NDU88_005611, partial [Pleurodeles waltl]